DPVPDVVGDLDVLRVRLAEARHSPEASPRVACTNSRVRCQINHGSASARMSSLSVAAGGAGDALAAAIVHRALGHRAPALIATYAWDRLAIDPLPGPRGL